MNSGKDCTDACITNKRAIAARKVFGLFKTLKPRDEVEGSGVGLALVKKMIEREGGEIFLESDTGKGAKFIFTWPLKPKKDTA